MTESGSVPVNVAALRTASVPSPHEYAVSESAWPPVPLANEHAPVDRIREGEKRVQRQVETGHGSQCSRIYHVLGRGELVWCTSAEAQRLAERVNESASRQRDFAAMHVLGDIANLSDQCDAEWGEIYYRKVQVYAASHASPHHQLSSRGLS